MDGISMEEKYLKLPGISIVENEFLLPSLKLMH